MSGRVRLQQGDMFSVPADLMVLPCSTAGTVTHVVEVKLSTLNLRYPRRAMELGTIELVPSEHAEHVAQYIAYAASVDNLRSSVKAIFNVGCQLGQLTREHELIRRVSVPLLGAGAGGLSPEESSKALAEGFQELAESDAILTIYVFLEHDFASVARGFESHQSSRKNDKNESTDSDLNSKLRPPRVFVSYATNDRENTKWVHWLATQLRSNGVESRIDQWHLRRGMDLSQWMCNELAQSDKVVLVCDKAYTDKADGRQGGVGWETMIVQGDMANLPPTSTKYLVIVREENFEIGCPMYLKTKFSIHWPSTASESESLGHLQQLLKELFDFEDIPPIGPPPVFVQ